MPGRDGTGPIGFGMEPGNGMGLCSGFRKGKTSGGAFLGRHCGIGFGRAGVFDSLEVDEKELLVARKNLLEKRLNAINEQLDRL